MAEQKKKTQSTELAEKENLPKRKKKASTTMRTYHAETISSSLSAGLGMPPLKMILVHAENERANAAAETSIKAKRLQGLTQEEAVMKIIEHLKSQ